MNIYDLILGLLACYASIWGLTRGYRNWMLVRIPRIQIIVFLLADILLFILGFMYILEGLSNFPY